MTKKYKIITASVASVLVLIIAGLAIGLVLVAQQVQMTNSVSVTYTANNVECEITIYAIHFLDGRHNDLEAATYTEELLENRKLVAIQERDEEGAIISDVYSVTDYIKAYENEGSVGATSFTRRSHTFDVVDLQVIEDPYNEGITISSSVGYFFVVKNTSSFGIVASIDREIYAKTADQRNNMEIAGGVYYEDGLDTTTHESYIAPNEESLILGYIVMVGDINEDASLNVDLPLLVEKA
ncbi:MAG: hypothetical protein IJA61_03445 [Clostridia bacterium]|nr:hypothetical protein [Clostridia bacterium]